MFIIEGNNNKKAKRPNFRKGSQSHSPSQTNGKAKVEINSEIAIPKLKNLAQRYVGVTDPHGFLTDLRIALGIPDSHGASKYGIVSIPKEDGNILQASLRVTNHQANANTYIDHNANYEYNLSIVVRRKQRKNTFIPNDNVILDEYVYYGTKMQDIENPLTQIVNGIIIFLQSGEYKDTTGIAFKNQSVKSKDRVPQNISINKDGNWVPANGQCADYVSESIDNKQHKTRYNMKKTIRLSESDLHRVIKESVKRMLKEGHYEDDERYDNSYRECLRLLTAAKESLITDFRNDTGYNENDPYYADLSNKHNSIIEKIDKAISECEEVALGGRIGTYDSENGYTPNPHLGGWNGEYNGIGY